MVFSSHNLGQVKRLASRVIYLEHGRLVADLPVHDFSMAHCRRPPVFVKGELVRQFKVFSRGSHQAQSGGSYVLVASGAFAQSITMATTSTEQSGLFRTCCPSSRPAA